MIILKLIEGLEIIKKCNFNDNVEEMDIKNICDDGRKQNLLKDSLFICIDGQNFDSHQEVNKLSAKGVKIFVCEKEIDTKLPYVIVKDAREALSKICNNFYDNPTRDIKLVGVVGTNGKTSTTYFIKKLLELNKVSVGLIGTSGVYIKNRRLEETLTTPDPLLLFSLFDKMKKAGCEVIVMEVSAHAIYLKKINSLIFDIGIFTNFSQDHLDFFKTMEKYKETKFSFFKKEFVKKAIVNYDDEAGKELFEKINNEICCETFSIKDPSMLRASDINLFLGKTIFTIKTNTFKERIETKTSCLFNVYNILASILTVKSIIGEFSFKLLKKLKCAKGRFEVYRFRENYIIIDYAHTPESLKSVLENVKKLSSFEILCLFGCPGNRDEGKRKIMGEIASNFSKEVYITTDNPKYENPLIICDEILSGTKNGIIIEDREEAIKTAISNLKKNQILLIIGKGSEKYQDVNNLKIKYNDFSVVKRCIKTNKKK